MRPQADNMNPSQPCPAREYQRMMGQDAWQRGKIDAASKIILENGVPVHAGLGQGVDDQLQGQVGADEFSESDNLATIEGFIRESERHLYKRNASTH